MEPDESTTNGRSPACDEMKALLSAYLDGELSRDERIRADTHAVGCRSCRDLIERAEELDRRIREEHRFDPGEVDTLDMQARVLAQIGSRSHGERRWFRPVAIAAALAAASAVAIGVLRDAPDGKPVLSSSARPASYASLDADDRQLLYSTGVILNGIRRPGFQSTEDFAQFRGVARYDAIAARLDSVMEKLAPEDRIAVVLAREAIEQLVDASADPAKWEELRRDMERTDLARRVDGLSEV